MRRKLLSLIMGGALSIAAIAPAAAANPQCETTSGRGGAAALIALVNANVSGVGINVCDIDVNVLNNSLNNLLQNADIHVLENILNNSPFLNDVLNDLTITVTNVANGIQVNVLGGGITIVGA
ncbi:MAG: hypothetical protein H0W41_03030 [Chloroflexi bacterium]|nr:hypothetical protein [Chloroflexota bacterium]